MEPMAIPIDTIATVTEIGTVGILFFLLLKEKAEKKEQVTKEKEEKDKLQDAHEELNGKVLKAFEENTIATTKQIVASESQAKATETLATKLDNFFMNGNNNGST